METPPAANDSGKLPRVLGPWIATAIVIGTVIGSGVFKKPAAVAEAVPSFGWAISAWVLMGVLVLFGGLAMADDLRFVATNVTPAVIPNSGHWIMEEQPSAAVTLIGGWLNTGT